MENFWIVLGYISSVLTIVTAVITFGLWVRVGRLKKEVRFFRDNSDEILNKLENLEISLFEENSINKRTIDRAKELFYYIQRNANKILEKNDKECLNEILEILNKDYDDIIREFNWSRFRNNFFKLKTLFIKGVRIYE